MQRNHSAKQTISNEKAFISIKHFCELCHPMNNDEPYRFPKLEKDEFYLSPEGYVVFTEKYLLKRGYCCKNGCKHCPYNYNIRTGKFDKKPQ